MYISRVLKNECKSILSGLVPSSSLILQRDLVSLSHVTSCWRLLGKQYHIGVWLGVDGDEGGEIMS